MRIIAIILLVALTAVLIGQYVISAENLAENRKDLKDRIEEHEDTHESRAEMRDCDQCESYKDSEKTYDRNATSLILSAAQTILLYAVYCSILFGIGLIISKPAAVAAPAYTPAPKPEPKPEPIQPVQPQVPTVTYCAKCGAQQQAGNRFCSVCGTPVER